MLTSGLLRDRSAAPLGLAFKPGRKGSGGMGRFGPRYGARGFALSSFASHLGRLVPKHAAVLRHPLLHLWAERRDGNINAPSSKFSKASGCVRLPPLQQQDRIIEQHPSVCCREAKQEVHEIFAKQRHEVRSERIHFLYPLRRPLGRCCHALLSLGLRPENSIFLRQQVNRFA
jgi:hypothetical protein